jgi:putative ubiquitin-RnfH superfamily antitoxin RatB of RatAB toxin-antitoxin module
MDNACERGGRMAEQKPDCAAILESGATGGKGGIAVEVCYAMPQRQWRVLLRLPPGSSVLDAIERSNLRLAIRDLMVDDEHVGIFAAKATLATRLRDGDRVELYRPLLCDPKQVRRERAASSKKSKPVP